MAAAFEIVFEDAHLLAVVKPAGLLVQGTAEQGPSLENLIRRYLGPDDPEAAYVGTIHRLDRPVSGLVVWAKTVKAARRMAAQFSARDVVKEYWAVVETPNTNLPEQGLWEDWLLPPNESGVAQIVDDAQPRAKRAVTRYQRETSSRIPKGAAWLRLWPETGRTHQLRAQAAGRGWPIWGDVTYGSSQQFRDGIALHARGLRFHHPISQQSLELVAKVPSAWGEQGISLP